MRVDCSSYFVTIYRTTKLHNIEIKEKKEGKEKRN